ncbi:MAG: hypothetical protein S4CHLAM102_06630 [Chlamydiia bacterium]|nr:hypothetical protein [Chlamydiia bacterium]
MTENNSSVNIVVDNKREWCYFVAIVKYLIHTLFLTYSYILIAGIFSSWIPSLNKYRITQFVRFYTDPYLNLFRKVIPPLGGVLDLSPIIGIVCLQLAESFIMKIL